MSTFQLILKFDTPSFSQTLRKNSHNYVIKKHCGSS